MRLLDSDRLTVFLRRGADAARSPVVQAVYAGLEARVSRGDFDAGDVAHDLGDAA